MNDLGRIGAWSFAFSTAPVAAAREGVARLEALGYGSLWYPETPAGRESLSNGAILLAATERVAVCSGIASIWARDAVASAWGADGLGEAFDERFVLGLGVSHKPSVESRGSTYGSPLSAMRRYLDAIDAAGPERRPRLLAALAPKMLELARDRADGAHTYFVPPEHTRIARLALGPESVLAVELAVVLETSPAAARDAARRHTERYLSLPNYRSNLLRLGWADEDVSGGGSDALVDRVVAWGDEEAIAARVAEHLDAGASHVCIQPLTPDRSKLPNDEWERLAPALGLTA